MAAKKPDMVPRKQHTEITSALKVQRDSHQRRNVRLETQNRILRKHQEEIRTWLAEAVEEYAAARKTDRALTVADELIKRARGHLDDAQRTLRDNP